MICVYDPNNTDFESNGNAVLMPTECRHTQAAAGKYDLTITHPIDPGGKWQHIVEEAIIRAPVQEETIENAYSGMEADLYQTNQAAALRSAPNEPEPIVYDEWIANRSMKIYAVGDKVTYLGQNYQMKKEDPGSEMNYNHPPNNYPEYWTKIANQTPGAPVLVNLKAGMKLYYVSAYDSTWCKVTTLYGLEGYIKISQITFVRHLEPSETQPRHITTQLFRIRSVSIDTKGRTVTATAEHVSYDMKGVMVRDVHITRRNPATALAWIETGTMMDYQGMIATDMTSDSDGTYTGEFNGKNLIFCLLDPDKGIVSSFEAQYRRDNWDVFVMRKTDATANLQLRYRKNLLGVSWNKRSDGLVTRVVPVAKAADGSDFFLTGSGWVDSTRINDYPVVRMEWLRVSGQVGKDDGTETATNWTETTLRAEMLRQAQNRYSVDKADQVIHEITLDFEMLGDTDEYAALKGLEKALMYEKVIVIDETVGLSVTAEVVEIEYDAIRKKVRSLKLSNVNAYGGKNVTGFNVINNSITGDKLTDDAVREVIGTTKEDAVEESKTYTVDQINAVRAWAAATFVAQE